MNKKGAALIIILVVALLAVGGTFVYLLVGGETDPDPDPKPDPDSTPSVVCGDGICHPTEERGGANKCSKDCRDGEIPLCGNDIINTGEECDDGNTISGDGCSVICKLEENGEPPVVNGGGTGNVVNNKGDYDVDFMNERSCSGGTCVDYSVECGGGLVSKTGTLLINDHDSSPKGTIMLMTGGSGKNPYHTESTNHAETVEFLQDADFRVVEMYWTGQSVITQRNNEGIKTTFCAPQAVHREFKKEYPLSGPWCAQGNSGGGFQILYGLTFYGTDDDKLWDTVIVTSSPPVTDFPEACNSPGRNPDFGLPPSTIGIQMADSMIGGNVKYCQDGSTGKIDIYDFPEIIKIWEENAVVNNNGQDRNPTGDYYYPNTKFFNIVSEADPTLAHTHAKLYYDLITAKEKDFFETPEAVHDIPSTESASNLIRQLMVDECV